MCCRTVRSESAPKKLNESVSCDWQSAAPAFWAAPVPYQMLPGRWLAHAFPRHSTSEALRGSATASFQCGCCGIAFAGAHCRGTFHWIRYSASAPHTMCRRERLYVLWHQSHDRWNSCSRHRWTVQIFLGRWQRPPHSPLCRPAWCHSRTKSGDWRFLRFQRLFGHAISDFRLPNGFLPAHKTQESSSSILRHRS